MEGVRMRQLLFGAIGLFAFTVTVASFVTPAQAQGESHIRRGYAIAPVPLDTGGLNPALVGLGSYIVNAQGGCNDCHTNPPYAPGGNPFAGQAEVINAAGYLAGGVAFGPFVSRNLTP